MRDPAVRDLDAKALHLITGTTDRRVVWRRWGDGPLLVLLHGASGSWTHWIRNIAALSASFTVLAPDLPGFGDSDDAPQPHTLDVLVGATVSGLDTLAPGQEIRLAGFSLGGIVAGVVAARLRERVRALVLIGAGGLALPDGATGLTLQRLAPGATETEARVVHRANLVTLMLGDPAAADDLAVDVQIANLRRARFKSGVIPLGDDLLRALPDIRAPLAGLWGSRDVFGASDLDGRRAVLARHHPRVDFRVVPGAGHWVIYEAAETVNRALLEVLTRARPGDRPHSA